MLYIFTKYKLSECDARGAAAEAANKPNRSENNEEDQHNTHNNTTILKSSSRRKSKSDADGMDASCHTKDNSTRSRTTLKPALLDENAEQKPIALALFCLY